MYTKEGTRVPSLNSVGSVCSVLNEHNRGKEENDYNKGKFGNLIEQLLSTFSVSSQAPALG